MYYLILRDTRHALRAFLFLIMVISRSSPASSCVAGSFHDSPPTVIPRPDRGIQQTPRCTLHDLNDPNASHFIHHRNLPAKQVIARERRERGPALRDPDYHFIRSVQYENSGQSHVLSFPGSTGESTLVTFSWIVRLNRTMTKVHACPRGFSTDLLIL